MICMNYFAGRNRTGFETAAWRFVHRLVPVVYALSGLAFVCDLYRDSTLEYGIVYVPLVATAVFHKRRLGLWVVCGIATLMVAIGAWLPLVASVPADIAGNRILSILAIVATAAFVHHGRDIQERLAAAARRAEASERVKADVLTDLGREIPASFHSLLGMLSLTIAASQPDQREALARVRGDGRRLLATIENLLDLTQIDERRLRRQAIDVGSIARDAAEDARVAADQRQVRIAVAPDQDAPGRDGPDRDAPDRASRAAAIGDSWAMRRILDNLLDNAVRITPPGGTVSVSVARDADTVTASVSDTGSGLPPALEADFRDGNTVGDALPETGGTGLALSERLARAMNGRLTAHNGPNSGATVSLSLPAA